LDEAKLDKKVRNNQVFFGYWHNSSMTGQNRHNWPDFFCQGTLGEGLARGWARVPAPPPPNQNGFKFLG